MHNKNDLKIFNDNKSSLRVNKISKTRFGEIWLLSVDPEVIVAGGEGAFQCENMFTNAHVCTMSTVPIEIRSLQLSCAILLFSCNVMRAATHHLPLLKQLDKIYLMMCQVCPSSLPPPPPIRLSGGVLSFSINRPWTVYNDLPPSQRDENTGDTEQQLPMSENRRAATCGLLSLTGMACMSCDSLAPLLATLRHCLSTILTVSCQFLRKFAI